MSGKNLATVHGESSSSTGFLLREFAKVVADEERDLSNSTDRLIQAADEVHMLLQERTQCDSCHLGDCVM